MSEVLTDIGKTALGVLLGTVISMVVTGFLVNKFVIKRIMGNKDIQDIVKLIREAKDELMKHNENGKLTLPEAADHKG